MLKTKTVEFPELKAKITIEWTEQEAQMEFPVSLSLPTIEDLVYRSVVGGSVTSPPQFKIFSSRNKQQYFANARHVFCFVAVRQFKYSVSDVAHYIQRDVDSVKHSVKRVTSCCQKTDPALWTAFKRYEQ